MNIQNVYSVCMSNEVSVKYLPIIIMVMFLRKNNSVTLHVRFFGLTLYHTFVSFSNLYILGIAFFYNKVFKII